MNKEATRSRAAGAPMLSAPEVLTRIFVFGALVAFIGFVYLALPVGPRPRCSDPAPAPRSSVAATAVVALGFARVRQMVGARGTAPRLRGAVNAVRGADRSCPIEWPARTPPRTSSSTWRRFSWWEAARRPPECGCEWATSSFPPRHGPRSATDRSQPCGSPATSCHRCRTLTTVSRSVTWAS